MNAARTLDASAEAFLAIGDECSHHFCKTLAEGCREIADELGQEIADALYRPWTSELAERASLKLAAFSREANNV